jgi:hypothetical protein
MRRQQAALTQRTAPSACSHEHSTGGTVGQKTDRWTDDWWQGMRGKCERYDDVSVVCQRPCSDLRLLHDGGDDVQHYQCVVRMSRSVTAGG